MDSSDPEAVEKMSNSPGEPCFDRQHLLKKTGCLDDLQFLLPYLHLDYHYIETFPEPEAELCTSSALLPWRMQNFAKFGEFSWVAFCSAQTLFFEASIFVIFLFLKFSLFFRPFFPLFFRNVFSKLFHFSHFSHFSYLKFLLFSCFSFLPSSLGWLSWLGWPGKLF